MSQIFLFHISVDDDDDEWVIHMETFQKFHKTDFDILLHLCKVSLSCIIEVLCYIYQASIARLSLSSVEVNSLKQGPTSTFAKLVSSHHVFILGSGIGHSWIFLKSNHHKQKHNRENQKRLTIFENAGAGKSRRSVQWDLENIGHISIPINNKWELGDMD